MALPVHLLPDPASARHLLLRAPDALPVGPLAHDPRAAQIFRQRPQILAKALARCLRDHAAAGPDARALPLLLLAARLRTPALTLLPALARRRARALSLLARAHAKRQQNFYTEQVRALDALERALVTGEPPGKEANSAVFGCRAAFPAAWAARDVIAARGLPQALVPEPDADPVTEDTTTGHGRLRLALAVAETIALPDLQRRLRQARDARRTRCILSAAALYVLHDVPIPEVVQPHLLPVLDSLPARDRSLLKLTTS